MSEPLHRTPPLFLSGVLRFNGPAPPSPPPPPPPPPGARAPVTGHTPAAIAAEASAGDTGAAARLPVTGHTSDAFAAPLSLLSGASPEPGAQSIKSSQSEYIYYKNYLYRGLLRIWKPSTIASPQSCMMSARSCVTVQELATSMGIFSPSQEQKYRTTLRSVRARTRAIRSALFSFVSGESPAYQNAPRLSPIAFGAPAQARAGGIEAGVLTGT